MMDEQFAEGDSLLHKRDPKAKIIASAIFITAAALTRSSTAAAMFLAFAAILCALTGLPLRPILKRLLAVNSFTFFLWITLPPTYGGNEFITLGPLSLSVEGIRLAALITLKTNAVVLAIIALLGTSRIANTGHALETLHLPQGLCFIMLFSYRYIFVIYQEYQRLVRAARLRCFKPATNIHTYRTFGYLFGMTLVKSWNRASRVHQAMILRGFDGHLIPLSQDRYRRSDTLFLLVILTLTLSIALVGFQYP
ncbi:MAG: cobalt ECF transporter T component CbiQ [Deltaproteobacteria bacterium]|nr:cobalt ECF transporter T component CbiQ [Deltaproteobacteria bacterium]MBW2658400.1 cobalt ECF transporter T component CbiQ [Deltaproteobacteria bacterium]